MRANRIYIISNGNLAPYGIGEIIDIIPEAHIRKVHREVAAYYNEPIMRRNAPDGQRVQFVFDQSDRPVGFEARSEN